GVRQGGGRARHRLAAARRPPGRDTTGGTGRPRHARPAHQVHRIGADRGGRRAQRRRLLGRGDLRLLGPPARGRQGRGELKTWVVRAAPPALVRLVPGLPDPSARTGAACPVRAPRPGRWWTASRTRMRPATHYLRVVP